MINVFYEKTMENVRNRLKKPIEKSDDEKFIEQQSK